MHLNRLPRLLMVAALGLIPSLLSAAFSFAQAPPPVPALPDTERRTQYSISASTCACSVGFALFGSGSDVDQWLEVWVAGTRYLSTDPSHGWALTSATGTLATIPRPITDAVLTFTAVQTGTVQIVGAARPRRTAQFAENRGVAARDLNQVLTDLVAQNRETWDKINDVTGRGFFAPPGSTGGTITSPLFGVISSLGPFTDGHIAVWNGTSGTSLKDGGAAIWITPEQFGAIGNGIADDTAAIQSAINQAQSTGGFVYLTKKYGFCPNGALGYGLLISSSLRIEGWGTINGIPYGWLFPLASGCSTPWTTSIDLIKIRGSITQALDFLALRNFTVGNAVSAQGRNNIYIDTRGGAAAFGFAHFNDLDMFAPASATGLGLYQQNDGTEATGGMFTTEISGGLWSAGIYLQNSGSTNIIHHVLLQGAGIGIEFGGIAGETPFFVEHNNIANSGGGIQIDSGDSSIIRNNAIELTGGAGAGGCLVNIVAGNSAIFQGNALINGSSNASLLNSLCIGASATGTVVDTNAFYSTNATQITSGHWISNAGTRTQINRNQYYQASTVTDANAISDTGTGTYTSLLAARAVVADAAYAAKTTDRTIAYTSISASRIVSLPPASSFGKGERLCIRDDSGSASGTNTIRAAPNGSDTIQGSNSTQTVVNQPQGEACLESSGTVSWFIPLQYLTGDITGNISQGNAIPTTLATVNSNVGTFGSSDAIPVVTANGKGLATAVTTAVPRTRQMVTAATSGAVAANSTVTFALQPVSVGFAQPLFPFAGTIKNFYIATQTAAGAGQTYTATIFTGTYGSASATTITCVMSNTTSCNDTTHSVAVAAGQAWYISVTASVTATGSTGFGAGFELDNP